MPRRAHGSRPDTYDERLRRGRTAPGEVGQYLTWQQHLTRVGDRRVADRYGWPVDALGTPVLDLSDEDMGVPHVGPTLSVTGTPDHGRDTPWIRCTGHDVLGTGYLAGEHHKYTAAPFDPPPGEGMVAVVLAYIPRAAAGTRAILGTRNSGNGWFLLNWNTGSVGLYCEQGVNILSTNSPLVMGWLLISCKLSFSPGLAQSIYINGALVATGSTPLITSVASTEGVAINADTGGTRCESITISRSLIWYGGGIAGIADAAWHRHLAEVVLGTAGSHGPVGCSHARASSSIYDLGSRIHILGQDCPPAGGSAGLQAQRSATNKCYNTVNPTATAGWTATGGVLSVVDDSAALLAAGLREAGPNVIQLVNATGVARRLYGGAQTGNTNPHSLQIRARMTAGAGATLGLRDASAGTYVQAAVIIDDYGRTEAEAVTPADTDCQFCVLVPDGCTVRLCLAQLEEASYCSIAIPNWATAATALRAQDVLTLPAAVELPDVGGRVEATITPGFDAGEQGGTARVLTRATVDVEVIRVDDTAAQLECHDGTAEATAAITEVDGTSYRARASWGDRGLIVDEEGGNSGTVAYDGALGGSGAITIEGCDRAIGDLRILRSQGGSQ